ncbi:annexin D4-like [Magnolia sinica]|uniref:annexin D4-like n=1 Tax=Magnolia sinica TaxID=86752 RepID=UPI002659D786|nr:annexin D4-like [Magnolia sinica]
MAHSLAIEEFEALTRAFSGFGVDEKSIITVLSKWHPEQRKSFRKSCPQFFKEDDRFFERWEDYHISILEREFARFKKAMILCTLHPSERDARLAYEVIHKGQPLGILIEIACTRSSEELLGARRAYHSLFNHSLEEDVAYHVRGANRSLLVALVSSYRYEGTCVKKEIAGSEAKTLGKAIKEASMKKLIENEDVVRILSTRSKLQLKVTFDEYKEMFGEAIDKVQ